MGLYNSILAIGIFFGSRISAYYASKMGSYTNVYLGLAAVTALLMLITYKVVKRYE